MSKLCGAIIGFILLLVLSTLTPGLFAQEQDTPLRERVGMGIKASSLGAGAELATPLSRTANLRVGFNTFRYDRNFHKDGVGYAGQLSFQSVEAHYDWFPFYNGFHVSPGLLVYNGNRLKADVSVPAGQNFTLNKVTYLSDPANPVTGNGRVELNKVGPMLTAGWGNLLPRNGRRFSIPFEIGAIYSGAPRASLNFGGGACDATGVNCRPISSDLTVQSNVLAERNKLNSEMAPYKVYPVISIGFGFSF